MKQSAKFTLNKDDAIKFGKEALIFLGPTLLVLLPSVANALPSDWKYAVIVIYILNRLVSLLKLFLAGK